ncbi:uncharacterized protein TrAtP1_006602 [Trichoderma atroviride]|uniref:uncharacterized protein n=1 Tax=Hypocrea atroviridis TaxID=63577 RepID=UPI003321669F|nr:hypothetical protein TrAtP1_006602 [Trichoderma atroviride]
MLHGGEADEPIFQAELSASFYQKMLPERCISQINLHVSLADADHDGICRDNLHNPEMDRRRLIRVNGRRVPGTCEWIRDNVLYRSWLTCSQPSSDTALLWITGGPGMGKTMLSIFVIEELEARARQEQEPLVTLLFFFCSSNEADRNTAVAILSGLLFQLIEQHPGLAKHASYYLKPSHAASSLASFDTLWHIFERILGDVALQTVQCVLDGLDECGRESAGWLLTALEGQARSSPGRFRLLVLSRQMDGLEGFTRLRLDVNNDKPLASDIERCIADGVRRLSRLDGIASKVCDMLQAKSDGTFLWVGLILKELAKKKTSQEVWETIHSLPKGLNKIYSRILDQIQPQQQDESARLLRWVATAMRPLRLEELQELRGLAGCGDGPACLVSSLQACREQVVCCEGLLRIHDDAVHLVHQSARDYLLGVAKPFGIRPEEAHLELARHCLSCLEQSEAQSPSPLLDYATMYWPEHARQSKQHANKVLERSRPLFRDGSPLGLRWWQVYRRTKEPGADDAPPGGEHVVAARGCLFRHQVVCRQDADRRRLEVLEPQNHRARRPRPHAPPLRRERRAPGHGRAAAPPPRRCQRKGRPGRDHAHVGGGAGPSGSHGPAHQAWSGRQRQGSEAADGAGQGGEAGTPGDCAAPPPSRRRRGGRGRPEAKAAGACGGAGSRSRRGGAAEADAAGRQPGLLGADGADEGGTARPRRDSPDAARPRRRRPQAEEAR